MTNSTTMTNSQETDIDEILADPSTAYDHPIDVVRDDSLTQDDKTRILEEWKLDAKRLAVANSEGMTGGEPDMLSRVSDALLALEK